MMLRAIRRRAWNNLAAYPSRRIGDILKVTSGGTPSRRRPDYFGGAIPWVKTGEVAFCTVDKTEESITDLGLRHSAAKLFPADTVLIAMYGRGTVGAVSDFGPAHGPQNQACAALLPCDQVRPRFLFHWLWSHYDQIVDQALGTTNLTNISKAIIDEIEVIVPPHDLQDELVTQFDACLDLVDAERLTLTSSLDLSRVLVANMVAGGVESPIQTCAPRTSQVSP